MVYINSFNAVGFDIKVLDGLYFLLTLIVIWHALLYTKYEGLRLLGTVFTMALMTEQLSIQLGHTHCHMDGMVMLSKCSSVNSVLTYLPCECLHMCLQFESQVCLLVQGCIRATLPVLVYCAIRTRYLSRHSLWDCCSLCS
jgi:hypothetical protein